ncbi:hypothetical protein CK204_13845 [Klebsiella pneumoniae]|nr:hypothetical protein BHG05_10910 [Klebsiella pneumoniae]PAW96386.1 hypothetical protein CKQ79_22400 [Klebsiella pneumoniae]PHQ12437.1 hypothetical protein CKQ87_05450 [Klebsiella pneumoniae]PHY99601.1 hypothetical protein CK204_13845 [Klebsiella pneumoniae]
MPVIFRAAGAQATFAHPGRIVISAAGIIAGDRLMRAAFLCPPFFAERLRYGVSAKKNTICLPDLVRLGFLFRNSDGR